MSASREQQTIAALARLVSEIAARCWPDLGTDASGRISREADAIAVAILGGNPASPVVFHQ